MINIVVHVHKGSEDHGYEMGTRQAWKLGARAQEVNRVIGVIHGKIVCVIDNVRAELSTPHNNLKHNVGCEGRYIFLGGKCYTVDNNPDLTPLMFKKIKGLNQGHRYLTDDELHLRLA